MAIVKSNIITQGLSGTIGGEITFKQFPGRTVAARKRRPNQNPPKPGEQAGRDRFRAAGQWYQQVVKPNPDLKAAYAAVATGLHQTAQNMAIADFMNSPQIHRVDISAFTGQPGGKIRVLATDNFRVMTVAISILNPDGTVTEAGTALSEPNSDFWIYTTNTVIAAFKGCQVQATASDLPGNTVEHISYL